jgi:hypothetical protein
MNRVECPGCGRRLKFADEHAGKTAKCKKCSYSFTLPKLAKPRPASVVSQAETAACARGLGLVEGFLIPVVAIYFLIGTLLASEANRNTIRGEDQGDAIARDAGGALCQAYQMAFEPVNRPFRPLLPKEGRYQMLEIDHRYYYLDVAPLAAGFVVIQVLVLGFAVARRVLRSQSCGRSLPSTIN